MSIKVMVVDDHAIMREGLKQLLEHDGSIEIVGEAVNGEECINKLQSLSVDVLLLDINLPIMSGLDVLKVIKSKHIPVKVLFLTVHDEIEYLMKAYDIGFDGYIMKDSGYHEIMNAINSVMKGEMYIQASLIPELNSRLVARDVSLSKVNLLTPREYEILVCIAKGMLNREIADYFSISERTVKNHISSIFK
ncbi:MAG: response regulator transcription factor, partial [Lachnospiraceae bacterium]|nr:response regulator transcription factor [Lachnospiraceae bacterium]